MKRLSSRAFLLMLLIQFDGVCAAVSHASCPTEIDIFMGALVNTTKYHHLTSSPSRPVFFVTLYYYYYYFIILLLLLLLIIIFSVAPIQSNYPIPGAGGVGHVEYGTRADPSERSAVLEADRRWGNPLPIGDEPRGGTAHS